MILSDLLGSRAVDHAGTDIGWVLDVRFVRSGENLSLESLIIGEHRRLPFLGYERANMDRPKLFAILLRRIHAGTVLVAWDDIEQVEEGCVRLRHDFVSHMIVEPRR